MTASSLIYDRYEPTQEGLREALCTLGNGYFATRGASPHVAADGVHYPGTYMAGCYNRLKTDVAGRQVENEDLVNLPNWLPLTFRIEEDGWIDLAVVELLSFRQELDLENAILIRAMRFRDAAGRTTKLAERRLVHMREPHLAALELVIEPEDWSGRVVIRSALDGRIVKRWRCPLSWPQQSTFAAAWLRGHRQRGSLPQSADHPIGNSHC